MIPSVRTMIQLLGCLVGVLAVASAQQTGWPQHLIDQSSNQWNSITPDATELYRIVFHTENNEFIPGCERTFMFQTTNQAKAQAFNVTVKRLSQVPSISSQFKPSSEGGSINDYNFNAAYVPLFVDDKKHVHHALLVRTQNRTNSQHGSLQGLASPSMLFMAYEHPNHPGVFDPITYDDLSLYPIDKTDAFGVEDPRIVYDDQRQEWVLLYTAVEILNKTSDSSVMARLSLATSKNITDARAWVRHGPIITDQWSKSGALLVRPLHNNATSFLYWGDSNNGKGMSLAITDDLRTFKTINEVWLPIRPEPYFDNILVEGGPAPLRLSTGDLFYLFNSAGHLKVNDTDYSAYHLTFALIDKKDPTVQLFRSPVPILSCELGWEIGTAPWLDLTPYVVFAEGMRPFDEIGPDSFLAYYGGADSVVGAAIITVKFEKDNAEAHVKYVSE